MRRKLLEQVYDRMTEEEKRAYIQLSMQDSDHKEIMQALDEISAKADKGRNSFVTDLAANVAGNTIFNSVVWIASRLIGKL